MDIYNSNQKIPPMDGSTILAFFKHIGWITVSWCEPANADWEIWCVDDQKHGPFALRGYRDGDLTHWANLPKDPNTEVRDASPHINNNSEG